MTSQKTYAEACNDFDEIYNEAIKSREPVIVSREGIAKISN